LTDLRQLDPQQRNFGQTPFDIGQCRRDCPNFRAIEDRLPDILAFLESKEARNTDLREARERELKKKSAAATYDQRRFVADLNKEFGNDAVARGRDVFASNCARCHSSLSEEKAGPFANRDFTAIDQEGLRADWMGNDQSTLVSEVGTFRCRALHSNHMKGHVWEQYGSETLRSRPGDPALTDPGDGGRGSYRNISLLSVWAHAPFMHNNALGPELCGRPATKTNDFYRSSYVTADGKPLEDSKAPACSAYDPSVEGRFTLFKASMRDLLNPEQRVAKITLFSDPVSIAFGPRVWDGAEERQVLGFKVTIPAGTRSGALGNFQHKQFAQDLLLSKLRPLEVQERLNRTLGEKRGQEVFASLNEIREEVVRDPTKMIEAVGRHKELLAVYSSCTADVENAGHRFGEGLSAADKQALTAFLATL
jgi:hypothetical protein